MHRHTTIAASAALFLAIAHSVHGHDPVRRQVNYIGVEHAVPDMDWQATLRRSAAWQQFILAHPGWAVEFNEAAQKPHRAYGPGIATQGASPLDRAWDFIQNRLLPFGIPIDELAHAATHTSGKFHYVFFTQVHAGLQVLDTRLMVKMDHAGRVIAFGTDVYDGIAMELTPVVGVGHAVDVSASGIPHVVGHEVRGLRILPVPVARGVDHRLVHEVIVRAEALSGTPSVFKCYVDARTGELLYRRDQVLDHRQCTGHGDAQADAAAQVQVNGTVQPNGALHPAEVRGLPELRVSVNGNFLFTDGDGALNTEVTGPVDATIQLRGRWSIVRTNNVTPSTTVQLNEGMNAVSLDGVSTIQERDAYLSVNRIHARLKEVLPSFTGLDMALPTNVDINTGTCNAYYDGESINFYAQGGGCRSLATLPDVVYHEYGHGINDKYYQSLGGEWQNGAMHEGYADVWALTLTDVPVLAQGWQLSSTASFIRRYDQNPKVYPADLVGQVHADGEIIAGAWWDTYQLLGDQSVLLQLFAEAYPGLQATMPNGQEGIAFRDVLLDVLQADDDDGDITNGTPNGMAIVEGFAIHGITLLTNIDMAHDPLETVPVEEPITLTADVNIQFPATNYLAGVRAFYRLNGENDLNSILLVNTGGSTYTGAIPGQPAGTIVYYYLAVEDIFGGLSSVLPVGAALPDPNLPYTILVGYELVAKDDADFNYDLGVFATGLPTDNATSGAWEVAIPTPSFSGTNGAGMMVQPGFQHTPNGDFCWVTENATGPFVTMGAADVDDGTTTIVSDVIDLSGYLDPAFSYWRWYINNPPNGANPGTDWWQTFVSEDGGATWVPLEETRTSDASWRRMAFRVQDVVNVTSTFRIKFHASDSIRPQESQNGGSLVEAALDDIEIWARINSTGVDERPATMVNLFPDPATDMLNVVLALNGAQVQRLEVLDMTGRLVLSPNVINARTDRYQLDLTSLATGQYILRAVLDTGSLERRFSVVR